MAANRKVRAAAVQLAPSLSSRAATTDKVCAAIEAAAREGAELVVFPETVVPYYPYFSFIQPPAAMGSEHLRLYEEAVTVPGPTTARGRRGRARDRHGGRARRQRARPRHDLQRAADLRRRARAGAAPAQDHADLSRAHGVGAGRRRRPARGRHARRPRRRARLLGALQPAGALRADGRPRGDPREHVPRLAGGADLRRADRGDHPPSRARVGLLRGQRDRLAHARAARRGRGIDRASSARSAAVASPRSSRPRGRCSANRSPKARGRCTPTSICRWSPSASA